MDFIKHTKRHAESGRSPQFSILCICLLMFSAVMLVPVFQPSAHAVAAASCTVDLDGDRDVDGLDVAGFASDFDEGCLTDVAAKFGRTDVDPPVAMHRLNDTGITTYGDATRNDLTSPPAGFPGQDAAFGRDVTHKDDKDDYRGGNAGFNYTKIGSNGEVLPVVAAQWSAVLDNVTGLMWEMKSNDNGLHDRDWIYPWYNPDMTNNGGNAGTLNGGHCGGTIASADTYHFVQAVNTENFCGYSDWRMPTARELQSIVDISRESPAIDLLFFPDTKNMSYWSSSTAVVGSGINVWFLRFVDGSLGHITKETDLHIRLVRNLL